IELDCVPIVPAVPLWDPRFDVDRETAEDLPRLAGVDRPSIRQGMDPNLKGVSVEGMFPIHPDYPLNERIFLVFQWSSSEAAAGSDTKSAETATASAADSSADSAEMTGPDGQTGMIEAWLNAVEAAHRPGMDTQGLTVRWIAGVGDLMVQRGIQDILIAQGEAGLERILHDTLPVLRAQDFLMGNLEGAVTRRGAPTPKSYNFRFSPAVLPPLKSAGFDYFSITNNHCYDYGTVGFTDTLDHLAEHGIGTSGAGRTPAEAYAPYETEISAYPLKVFSVGAYPREKNGFDGRTQAAVTDTRPGIVFSGPQALDAIRGFAGPDSIDVIMAHGGEEWTYTPTAEQQAFYRSCIDAGADLVVGHHPHVLQGMEYYGNGLIAYSTGNFLFPGMYVMPHAEESVILSIGFIGDRPVYVRPYPVRIDNREISLEDPPGDVLDRLLRLSRDLPSRSP
ncbi:MAG: CapA family protein, partial [Spirochaetota bacterium]|nr:CapA family protein [Spirochaetota bacterium]